MQLMFTCRMLAVALIALLCVANVSQYARGATAAWIGGSTGNWSQAASWSGGVVPNNSQAASYLATVGQSTIQYTQLTVDLPTLELDQLYIQPVALVRVPSGSVLKLRDIGQASSLQRSLVGGGTLELRNGGRLEPMFSSSVISGSSVIRLYNGRVAGIGRLENGKLIDGYGLIGATPGTSDAAITFRQIGSTANSVLQNPRLMADWSGQTLTLSPAAQSGSNVGIMNHHATLGASNGGTLVIRGNGTTLSNGVTDGVAGERGYITAEANSEIRFVNNVNITGGTINGTGTVRLPVGETATLTGTGLANSNTRVDGTLNLLTTGTNSGGLYVTNTGKLNVTTFTNAAGATLELQPASNQANAALTATQTPLTNNGVLSGAGIVTAQSIVSPGLIHSSFVASTLDLRINSMNLGSTGTLRTNRSLFYVGNANATGQLFGLPGSTIDLSAASLMELNLAAMMPDTTITNRGHLRVNKAAQFGQIVGDTGLMTVQAPTSTKSIRGQVSANNALTIRAGSSVSRGPSLVVQGSGGSLDLTDNAWIVDYLDGTMSPWAGLQSAFTSGNVFSTTPGVVVGVAEANAIGSPATWMGESIDASALLLRATRAGDADLDGVVDFDD